MDWSPTVDCSSPTAMDCSTPMDGSPTGDCLAAMDWSTATANAAFLSSTSSTWGTRLENDTAVSLSLLKPTDIDRTEGEFGDTINYETTKDMDSDAEVLDIDIDMDIDEDAVRFDGAMDVSMGMEWMEAEFVDTTDCDIDIYMNIDEDAVRFDSTRWNGRKSSSLTPWTPCRDLCLSFLPSFLPFSILQLYQQIVE